jgi:hypothetical protein
LPAGKRQLAAFFCEKSFTRLLYHKKCKKSSVKSGFLIADDKRRKGRLPGTLAWACILQISKPIEKPRKMEKILTNAYRSGILVYHIMTSIGEKRIFAIAGGGIPGRKECYAKSSSGKWK